MTILEIAQTICVILAIAFFGYVTYSITRDDELPDEIQAKK